MSVCKRCGATLDWIRTSAGRTMPVDPEPVFVVEGPGPDSFVTDEGEIIRGRVARPEEVETREQKAAATIAFVPHWKTCPAADSFRCRR